MKYFSRLVSFVFICVLLNACISYSNTREINHPLYRAINHGNLEEVIQVLQNGMDINNHDGWSYFPLEYAAEEGQTEIVEYLISQGAENVNVAFQQAISGRKYDTARAIYQTERVYYFVFERLFDNERMTTAERIDLFREITGNRLSNNYLLLCAGREEYDEIIEKYNIDISSAMTDNGENILHIATRRNNVGLINYLVGINFDINSLDKNGNTALFYAISSAGPDINWEDPFFEDQNLVQVNTLSVPARTDRYIPNVYQAQRERGERIVNTIRILCENGININSQNYLGWTALHLSYIKYAEALRELLIYYGANSNIRTIIGKLPKDFNNY